MADTPFWADDDMGNRHKFQWDKSLQRVTTNFNGTTGWANVLTSETLEGVVRLHVCKQQPCLVRWAPSKYGHTGPPRHMQVLVAASTEPTDLEAALMDIGCPHVQRVLSGGPSPPSTSSAADTSGSVAD